MAEKGLCYKASYPSGARESSLCGPDKFTAESRAPRPFYENENSRLGSTLCLPVALIRIYFLVLVCAESLQWRPVLCDPTDCSLPGFYAHGILQARMLEWLAIPSSRGSSRLRDQTAISRLPHWQVGSLPRAPPRILFISLAREKKVILQVRIVIRRLLYLIYSGYPPELSWCVPEYYYYLLLLLLF